MPHLMHPFTITQSSLRGSARDLTIRSSLPKWDTEGVLGGYHMDFFQPVALLSKGRF